MQKSADIKRGMFPDYGSLCPNWFGCDFESVLRAYTNRILPTDRKENTLHSFLMIGQSNMAGRGYVKDVKPIYEEHIKMLVNGKWQTMTEPINHDRPTSGIGLAVSFAGAWRLKNENLQIGLIPCAEGGTSLSDISRKTCRDLGNFLNLHHDIIRSH
ncbi:sialate O-acetylesterase [Dyadobacter psychrophilus]|uniref:Sialate O-acetylesterase domain-containing protein n=1 Tax=Dyadobacter psychrophilus TaxID=651661 RepID=A0A1T5G5H4_9BACT|nr:sialate O-acetylesterase [Dyadobacter psychrophilus]SKC03592.1 hypothetical protein SAMN05660293_03677 [Dyadobacter psychrophilus]